MVHSQTYSILGFLASVTSGNKSFVSCTNYKLTFNLYEFTDWYTINMPIRVYAAMMCLSLHACITSFHQNLTAGLYRFSQEVGFNLIICG